MMNLSINIPSGRLSDNLGVYGAEEKFFKATPPYTQLIRELVQSKIEKKKREIQSRLFNDIFSDACQEMHQ